MVDKKKIHHWWRVLRQVKSWHLLIALVLLVGASLLLLRQNNLNMVEKRNQVKIADESNGDVKKALQELQQYVSEHMNTDMGEVGVYLEKTYQRAYDRAIQESVQNDSVSRSMYEQADQECQSVFNRTYSFPAYTQCVAEKLSTQNSSDPMQSANIPTVDLFRYNFISPIWSPDLAGFAVLLTGVIGLILLFRIGVVWVLYLLLRKHNN